MRDYAELVKAIRYCSEHDNCGSRCPRFERNEDCVGQLAKDAADAIEELVARDVVPMDFHERCLQLEIKKRIELEKQMPRWISVEERLPERTNPFHARDVFLVRLRSGCIKTLFYEYDNSNRFRQGMSPLFKEGWAETATPVTHWMPLPEPPKGVE